MNGIATILRGDARNLPLPDASVDLIVTSPPYFALRSYTDGGEHYDGQIGAEPTPAEYIASLIDCTREWMRVLKPGGSLFVNLGDKYSGYNNGSGKPRSLAGERASVSRVPDGLDPQSYGIPNKSLMLLPERYRIAAVDELGLIARAVLVWSKPNGLPESVTDRVRRSHEDWVHLTKQPRYFSAVDEIREASTPQRGLAGTFKRPQPSHTLVPGQAATQHRADRADAPAYNPLGKLPGSVWEMDEDEPFVRHVLRAVAAGAITIEEGERLWTGARDSCLTSIRPTDAGIGPDGRTTAATARPASSESDARTGPTGSPTDSSSDPSPTGSPSTTSAGTRPASGPNTLSPSPAQRTSGGHTHPATSAQMGIPSPTPTSSGPATAEPADAAGPATWGAHEHVETVWTVATEPLKVPSELGVDHFAAFPTEFPRRIIAGWSPSGICTACGEGRRPVTERTPMRWRESPTIAGRSNGGSRKPMSGTMLAPAQSVIIGEACACTPYTDHDPEGLYGKPWREWHVAGWQGPPTRPAVVLDPFGGTGTTALVASVLGRHGISGDMSADYCRLARWRTADPGQRAKAARVPAPPKQFEGQGDLFAGLEVVA